MGTRLYIGNLSFNTTSDSLRAALESDGRTVTDLHLPTDRETGRPRGFAFAEMGNERDAESAIQALNGRDMDGRTLNVNEARERSEGGRGGGGGGGGRSGGGGGGGRRW